jgi:pimeloyl-ACP methyl ester carboxylesterase
MELFYRKFGEGPPFVILHGLYGSSDNWVSIARVLSEFYCVWLIDARNHGRSPHSHIHNYQAMANDLFEFFKLHNIEKSILLGHSMGGKTAMYFADAYNNYLSHLIIIDIAPKSYIFSLEIKSDSLNHKQIMEGMLAINFKGIASRGELESIFSKHIENEKIRKFLMKNVKRDEDMSFCWNLNIQTLYNNIEAILAEFKPLYADSFQKLPVLIVKASESDYILHSDIAKIDSIFPNSKLETIPDAGHWLHIEKPELLINSILKFVIS